jgi:hypothetical protein
MNDAPNTEEDARRVLSTMVDNYDALSVEYRKAEAEIKRLDSGVKRLQEYIANKRCENVACSGTCDPCLARSALGLPEQRND